AGEQGQPPGLGAGQDRLPEGPPAGAVAVDAGHDLLAGQQRPGGAEGPGPVGQAGADQHARGQPGLADAGAEQLGGLEGGQGQGGDDRRGQGDALGGDVGDQAAGGDGPALGGGQPEQGRLAAAAGQGPAGQSLEERRRQPAGAGVVGEAL